MCNSSVGTDGTGEIYSCWPLRYGYNSIESILSTSELYELWTRSNTTVRDEGCSARCLLLLVFDHIS